MPFKQRTKKKSRKRRSTRQIRYTGSGLSKSYPIGKSFKFHTKYVEFLSVDAAASVVGNYVFSMNGLYDPNYTGTGHQPLGYDQVMPLYDHYTVIGSRARVTFNNSSTSTPQVVCIALRDNTTTIGNMDQIIENGMCRWTNVGSAGSGQECKTLTLNCSPSKFFGTNVMVGDKYKGSVSSNPTDQVYLHISTIGSNQAVNPNPVYFTIEIEYVAVLTEPKSLSLS